MKPIKTIEEFANFMQFRRNEYIEVIRTMKTSNEDRAELANIRANYDDACDNNKEVQKIRPSIIKEKNKEPGFDSLPIAKQKAEIMELVLEKLRSKKLDDRANDIIEQYNMAYSPVDFLQISFPGLIVDVSPEWQEQFETMPLAEQIPTMGAKVNEIFINQTELSTFNYMQKAQRHGTTLGHIVSEKRINPDAPPSEFILKTQLNTIFYQQHLDILNDRKNGDEDYPVYDDPGMRDERGLLTIAGQREIIKAALLNVRRTVAEPDASGSPVTVGLIAAESIRFEDKTMIVGIRLTTDNCPSLQSLESPFSRAIKAAMQMAVPENIDVILERQLGVHPLNKTNYETQFKSLEVMQRFYADKPKAFGRTLSYMMVLNTHFGGGKFHSPEGQHVSRPQTMMVSPSLMPSQ